ncbi:MAG: hypothetical protein ACRDL4_10965, partial [Thermoleophilaceae bacterium]
MLGVTAVAALTPPDDDTQITWAIEAVATSTDPRDCPELRTLAYMEQVSGLPGEAAIAGCRLSVATGVSTASGVAVSG